MDSFFDTEREEKNGNRTNIIWNDAKICVWGKQKRGGKEHRSESRFGARTTEEKKCAKGKNDGRWKVMSTQRRPGKAFEGSVGLVGEH